MSEDTTDVALTDGAALGTLSSSAIRSRVSDHMQLLTTDPRRYASEGRDLEVAQLYQDDADQGGNVSTQASAVIPLAASRSRSEFEQTSEGRDLVAAWDIGPGGFSKALTVAQEAAGSIVKSMGDRRHQQAFMFRFDQDVSEVARYHIYNEILQPAPQAVPANAADLTRFSDTQAGAEMIKEWGHSAPQHVATVWARIERFRRALENDGDFRTFIDWYSALQPAAVKAILRHLAK